LLPTLERHLRARTGVILASTDWNLDRVPRHLRLTFRVTDGDTTIAEGPDLSALRRQLAGESREAVADVVDDIERTGLTSWTPGTLARVVERRRAGQAVRAYPALVDETHSVAVRVFATEEEQRHAMWTGTRRLLLLDVPTPVPVLSRRLSTAVKLGLTRYPYGNVPDLLEDCVSGAVDALVAGAGGPAWDAEGYARLREAVRAGLPDTTAEIVVAVEKVVAAAHDVRGRLAVEAPPALRPSVDDMRTQLVRLIQPGFVTATGHAHLRDLARWITAIGRRLEKLPRHPARDQEWMAQVAEVQAEYDDLVAALAPPLRTRTDVRELRWMIEELRVSLFAQDLRTPYPVSDVRVYRALDRLRTDLGG
jgi:ATP-dependent helicase HrpA